MRIATVVESIEAISRLYSMHTLAILAFFLLFVFLSIRVYVRHLALANEHPSVFSNTLSTYPHIIFTLSSRENATKCAHVVQVIQSLYAAILTTHTECMAGSLKSNPILFMQVYSMHAFRHTHSPVMLLLYLTTPSCPPTSASVANTKGDVVPIAVFSLILTV